MKSRLKESFVEVHFACFIAADSFIAWCRARMRWPEKEEGTMGPTAHDCSANSGPSQYL